MSLPLLTFDRFQTPEASVRSLFHDPPGSHRLSSILLFFVLYFCLSIWTYGLSISAGVFIPSLLTGAAWGRVVGMGMEHLFSNAVQSNYTHFLLLKLKDYLQKIKN